jgi:chromosome segregation ATPase
MTAPEQVERVRQLAARFTGLADIEHESRVEIVRKIDLELDSLEEQLDFAQQALTAEGEYRATAERTIKGLEEQLRAVEQEQADDRLRFAKRNAALVEQLAIVQGNFHDAEKARIGLLEQLEGCNRERIELDAQVQSLKSWEPENELREQLQTERERADREKDRADALLKGYVKTQEQGAELLEQLETLQSQVHTEDWNWRQAVERADRAEAALQKVSWLSPYGSEAKEIADSVLLASNPASEPKEDA